MRWTDRGPEPDGVRDYDRRFAQGWVRYFQDRVGDRPTDSHWREFRGLLGSRSGDVCWYCERLCFRNGEDVGKAPTVDHFRPVSGYPDLAYTWDNWVFSCRRCNGDYKGDKWPASGYVDPSEPDVWSRPEQYFDYDAGTGEIIPKSGLPAEARVRALQTIEDLGLNKLDVRYYRLDWTRRFANDWESLPTGDRLEFAQYATRKGVEFAGATLMVIQQLQASEGM